MVKRKFFFLVVFMFLLMSTAFAADGKVEFEVTNFEVNSIVNDTIKGGFEIKNKTAYATDNLFYSIVLVPEDKDAFALDAFLYQSEPKQFSLAPGEEKLIAYEIGSFKNFYNDRYYVVLKIMNKTQTLWANEALGPYALGEKTEFLISSNYDNTHYYDIKGYTDPLSGPYFESGKSPKAYINIKSTYDEDVSLKPRFIIYKRKECHLSDPLKVVFGDEITFKPGEEKLVELKLPVMEEPESYLIKVAFIEGKKKVSYDYYFRYVVNGVSGKILGFTTYYDFTEDKVKINSMLIGPASDEKLEDVEVAISFFSEEINGYYQIFNEKVDLSSETINLDFSFKLPQNIETLTTRILLKYKGKIIAIADSVINELKINDNSLTDIKSTKYEKAVEYLRALDIVSGYPDGTFKPFNNITRAEFTSMALKFSGVNINEVNQGVKNNFKDVSTSHWAYKTINYAYQEGILSGYGDGSFKPDSNITYSEAITIVLNVAKFKDQVNEVNERWPNNYIVYANKLDVLSNIDINNYSLPANRGDVSQLIFNTYLIH